MRVERLAPVAATGAVISTIETISLRSSDRRVAVVEQQPAPVLGAWWYPDTNRLLYYRNGSEQLSRVQADLPGDQHRRPASRRRSE